MSVYPVNRFSQSTDFSPWIHENVEVESVNSDYLSEDREPLVKDPIDCERLTDPVIDECGHTFSRSTVFNLPRVIRQDGFIDPNVVLCPFTRNVVRIDSLRSNRYAEDTVRYFDKRDADPVPNDISGVIKMLKEMRIENREMHSKVDNLQKENTSLKEENRRIQQKSERDLASLREDMRKESTLAAERFDRLRQDNGELRGSIETLSGRVVVMQKQVNNLVDMTFCDRIVSLAKKGHLKTVRDRGLTEKEKSMVSV